jgi:hypothetical protein
MATVNFSIPEEINEAFQEAFANENKSVVIARLMQQAVEEKHRPQRRAAAIEALLDFRRKQRPVADAEIVRARKAGSKIDLIAIVPSSYSNDAAPKGSASVRVVAIKRWMTGHTTFVSNRTLKDTSPLDTADSPLRPTLSRPRLRAVTPRSVSAVEP